MGNILIGGEAESDYVASFAWYAERSQRAAEGFEAEFSQALEAIAANPDGYPFIDDRHRFYLLKRYPYCLIYRQTTGEDVFLVAVAHASRNPDYWSQR